MARPRSLAPALVLALLLLLPAAARAGFAPADDPVVEAEQIGSGSSLGTDAEGDTLVAWSQKQTLAQPNYEVKARWIAADGSVGPVLDLTPGGEGFYPRVAVTASGRAFVAWRVIGELADPDGVEGRWIEADGSLAAPLTIAAGQAGVTDAVEVQVAVDPAGVATVAWKNEATNTLDLRRVQPGGALSAIVPDVAGGSVSYPRIAALPDGSTLVVWSGSGNERVLVSPALAVGAPLKISETSSPAWPALATDAAGNALVVWRQDAPGSEWAIRGRLLDPAGAPVGGELTIDPLGKTFPGVQPTAAADSAGDFLATWNRQNAEGDSVAYARQVNLAGAFGGPAQPLSGSPTEASQERAALFDSGGAAAVWSSKLGEASTMVGRPLDALATPTGEAQSLHPGYGGQVGSVPALGFAAFLLEYPISGSAQGLVLRRYLVPPACSDASAAVRQGKPIAIARECAGAAIETVAVTEKPRHGTVAYDALSRSFVYRPRPGYDGSDRFAYVAANDGGSSAAARVTIDVGKDTARPKIKKLKLLRKRRPRFQVVVSETSRVRIGLQRRARVAGKWRYRQIGVVRAKRPGQRLTIPVKGRLAKRLAAGGRFRARAVATDTARNKSKPRKLGFRIAG